MCPRHIATLALATAVLLGGIACRDGDSTTVVATGGTDTDGIKVEGIGRVEAVPDTGIIDIGVAVEAVTVTEARENAATAAAAVIGSIKARGIEDRDIQTHSFSISPVHDYSNQRQPRIVGYAVSNTVTAKIRDVARLGEVIDAAAEAGGDATRVNSIRFEIDDRAELIVQARERAMEDAKAKAAQLADLAGVDVGAPVSISETSYSTPPSPVMYDAAREMKALASTPIELGTSTVEVHVTVRWALAGS